MKSFIFASRNLKEIVRDPLNFAFGLGFPIIILLLLTAIQANVPADVFKLEKLTPGIVIFGFSFISLFSATLISKDRSSSFLMRLLTSPLSASDFIYGYLLPLFPMAIMQAIICFAVAFILGLEASISVLMVIVTLLPAALLFISIGLLAGTIFNDKQVGGICGALLTNLTAWLSGTWFDLELVGGTFKDVAYVLPFARAVNASQAALAGNYSEIFPDLWWVIGYAIVFTVIAILVFNKKMKSNKF